MARPLRVLDLRPTTFDEQVALLGIGLNRPLAFRALLQKRIDLACRPVIHLSPPDGVGLRAVDGHERCCPPERHFLLEIGRSLRVLLHTVEHPERDVGHLLLFERVEQPGRGDVLRGALRRIGGDSTRGGDSTNHPPSQQDKPQTLKRRNHDGASVGGNGLGEGSGRHDNRFRRHHPAAVRNRGISRRVIVTLHPHSGKTSDRRQTDSRFEPVNHACGLSGWLPPGRSPGAQGSQ